MRLTELYKKVIKDILIIPTELKKSQGISLEEWTSDQVLFLLFSSLYFFKISKINFQRDRKGERERETSR